MPCETHLLSCHRVRNIMHSISVKVQEERLWYYMAGAIVGLIFSIWHVYMSESWAAMW